MNNTSRLQQFTMLHHRARALQRSLIAVALLTCISSPTWARDAACLFLDDAGNVQWAGSEAGGEQAVACGYFNNAGFDESGGRIDTGDWSSAFGSENLTPGTRSTGVGHGNWAWGEGSTALGVNNAIGAWNDEDNDGQADYYELSAGGNYSTAIGFQNVAAGGGNSAVGYKNVTNGDGSSALGFLNKAIDFYSSAVGHENTASGYSSNAFGFQNTASGDSSNVSGAINTASGSYSSAFGYNNTASGSSANAFGLGSTASATGSSAFGVATVARGHGSSAFGYFSRANGLSSVAMGGWYDRDGNGMIDPDSESVYAEGISAVAVGTGVAARGDYSAALGVNATAIAGHSVAIGFGAVSDREYTIAVGSAAQMNQIVNLAAGSEDEDAVNLSQLYPLATALGGGANYAGGVFTGPTYLIQSNNYTNIGSAFTAVDSALTDINARIVAAGGIQGERGFSAYEIAVNNGFAGTEGDWLQSLNGAQGPAGPTGPEGPAGGGPRSVTYDSDTRDVLTMTGADGTRIANVADAVEATDAVNLGQVEAGDAQTLSAANEYTDTTATQTLTTANAYTDTRFAELAGLSDSFEAFRGDTDRRFHQQDRRIDKLAAMSGAYAGMAMNTAGLAGRNRVGVGVGAQGGEQALAVGYQRAIGNRASVSIAGAFSGDEKSVSAGAGFSW